MSPEQVRAFQATHNNHLGRALRVDGDAGPETRWALDFATLCRSRRQIVLAAQRYLGVKEEPPGCNADRAGLIVGWLGRCGAEPGLPWCAAFVSHCLSQTFDAPVRVAGAQRIGRMYPATTAPLTGDIFWYPTGPATGHTGIVLGVGALEVMTIEGNCANAVRCVRRGRVLLRFARPVADESGSGPELVPHVPAAPSGTR